MRRWILALVVGLVLLVGLAACLLPERYAVNAPLGQLVLGRSGPPAETSRLEQRIRLPEGFAIAIWADGLPGVRFLRFTEKGDLLASRPRAGEIVRLRPDADGDGRSDGREVLLTDLDRPHGLDLHEGWLYVGETGAVLRARYDASAGRVTGAPEAIVVGLPEGGNHWTRTVRVGPDGALYVSVGSSCNVCIEDDPRRAAMLRYRPDGSGGEVFASGLRNSVGFDWHPVSGALYATDNGRDLLGDDFPPCELNRVEPGKHYGWPFVNGDDVPDPDYGDHPAAPDDPLPPVHGFRAHNAPLGMTFVRSESAPDAYRHAALVALHGSWNRTRKDGYRVVSLHWTPEGIEERDFAAGFELDGDVIGRPVDVVEGPDGAFYVSDDYAGAVYRIAYGEAARSRDRPVASQPMPAGDPLAGLSETERSERDARGRKLFAEHGCGGCHLAGQAPPGMVVKPLVGLSARHDVASLVSLLAAPQPPMPALPLREPERRDLAVHLLATYGRPGGSGAEGGGS